MSTPAELKAAARTLPLKMKLAVAGLLVIGTISFLTALWQFNQSLLIEIPEAGGFLSEGVIGTPRSINPLLAISDTDRDLSALVYSGLLRKAEDGNLVPDLAERYEVSDDGLTYTFILRDDLSWHDGTPLTAADVAFTIARAQDPATGSIRAATWSGLRVEAPDRRTVVFRLPQPFGSFLAQTTLGILPAHIWKDIPAGNFAFSPANEEPVGSGPYQLSKISLTGDDLPEYYEFIPFTHFALGAPHIAKIRFHFYPNESELIDAYEDGLIDSVSGLTPAAAQKLAHQGADLKTAALPRVFGIFFNQNEAEVFTQHEVREALDLTLDRSYITKTILKDLATPLDGPLPPGSFGYQKAELPIVPIGERVKEAANILAAAGWEKGEDGVLQKKVSKTTYRLAFTITTADVPELKEIASLAQSQWQRLGAKVDIRILDNTLLQQNAIRPRKYDALLFGLSTGDRGDLYPFWHSKERLDPGLNVAMYTSATVDRLLDQMRLETNASKRAGLIGRVYDELESDIPALFIYSPHFTYIVPAKLKGFSLPHVSVPADRLSSIYLWHIETDRVWPIFAPNDQATKKDSNKQSAN